MKKNKNVPILTAQIWNATVRVISINPRAVRMQKTVSTQSQKLENQTSYGRTLIVAGYTKMAFFPSLFSLRNSGNFSLRGFCTFSEKSFDTNSLELEGPNVSFLKNSMRALLHVSFSWKKVNPIWMGSGFGLWHIYKCSTNTFSLNFCWGEWTRNCRFVLRRGEASPRPFLHESTVPSLFSDLNYFPTNYQLVLTKSAGHLTISVDS